LTCSDCWIFSGSGKPRLAITAMYSERVRPKKRGLLRFSWPMVDEVRPL
jgi:hypothetical protein